MHLNPYEMGYFIQQVGLAAASFGVTTEDVTAVGMALNKLFNYRCSPPTVVVPEQGERLQAMCIAPSCPLAENNTCSAYEPAIMPMNATTVGNASAIGGQGKMNRGEMNGTANGSSSTTASGAGAAPTGAAAAGGVTGMLSLTVVVGAMVVGVMML